MRLNMVFRMGIDLLMTISLIFLMAYQVTGEKGHEWLGTGMILLFLIHIFLIECGIKIYLKENIQNFV